MIYLDNAATTLHKPRQVKEAVYQAMDFMGNAGRGAHDASLGASRMIYETREKLAAFFGVSKVSQVVFTSNATESLNIAINGLMKAKDHVITTQLEHNSVLRPLYRLREKGLELTIVNSNKVGTLDYADFEKSIKKNTKAIVCTHASNLTGNKLDLKRISTICKKHSLLLIVDASQTAGVFPINMEEMDIDVLCFTGHKSLLGPQGTGGLCVREGLSIEPLKVGGSGVATYEEKHPTSMPTALEAGTLNGHGIAGLFAALNYIETTGMKVIREKEIALMEQFYQSVKDIPKIKIYGDFTTKDRAPIVALNLGDCDSAKVSDELYMEHHIATRPGAHCAPLMHKALGTVAQGAVRFSFSFFNTDEEIAVAVRAIKALAAD